MRMFGAVLAVLAAVMAMGGHAQAAPLTMGQLLVRCAQLDVTKDNQIRLRSSSVGDALDAGKCFGHLEAYLDLATVELHVPGIPNAIHLLDSCPPASAQLNFTKVIAMFLDYARNHPEEQQEPAALVVANLLARKYPCHVAR
jgi:Rap1a immunity proteins